MAVAALLTPDRSRLKSLLLLGAGLLCAIAAKREFSVWQAELTAKENTPESLRAALAATPADASKWRQLGLLTLETDSRTSTEALGRAIQLNAYEADALVGLALHAEAQGDEEEAESLYKRAARVSRRFKPSFALASFYARAGRSEEFWSAARTAAAIDQADVSRIIRLARDTGADPNSVPRLLHLETQHALTTYLRLAIADGYPTPLTEVAMRLQPTTNNAPILLQTCDRLIELGAADAAVRVWNRLEGVDKLNIAKGMSLSNPSFEFTPVRGFNWRYYTNPGVDLQPSSAGLTVEFSGDQREHVLVLEQIVPVAPERAYRFTVDSEPVDAVKLEGLSLLAHCIPSRAPIGSAPLSFSAAKSTSLSFKAPRGCSLASLMLVYNRAPGTVRITGSINLQAAKLELLP